MKLTKITKPEPTIIKLFSPEVRELDRAAWKKIAAGLETDDSAPVYLRAHPAPGGSKNFVVQLGDEEETVDSLTGVVLDAQRCNVRFDPDEPNGSPPVCSSDDARAGIDLEGAFHSCRDCPFNKFGSDGRGKACKNVVRIYLLTADSPLPILLSLPPTSLRGWENYRLGVLAPALLDPSAVVTEFSLESLVSTAGNKFSTVKPRLVGRLDEDSSGLVQHFMGTFPPAGELSAADYPRTEEDAE